MDVNISNRVFHDLSKMENILASGKVEEDCLNEDTLILYLHGCHHIISAPSLSMQLPLLQLLSCHHNCINAIMWLQLSPLLPLCSCHCNVAIVFTPSPWLLLQFCNHVVVIVIATVAALLLHHCHHLLLKKLSMPQFCCHFHSHPAFCEDDGNDALHCCHCCPAAIGRSMLCFQKGFAHITTVLLWKEIRKPLSDIDFFCRMWYIFYICKIELCRNLTVKIKWLMAFRGLWQSNKYIF